jgi:hypothetical protein
LWRAAGWQRSRTVTVSLSCPDLPMTRPTAGKALRALEGAGLVRIERQPGQCHRVTILDAPDGND